MLNKVVLEVIGLKVIVLGPKGKMGKAIVQQAHENPEIELVGVVGPRHRDYIGKDVGFVCDLGAETHITVHDTLEDIIDDCDLVLDCTLPDVSMKALDTCLIHGKAFVSGTTGFTAAEEKAFTIAGEKIPVILAGNTSKMTNVLYKVIREVAALIGEGSDIDIIDMHDNKKLDAPSGTSKAIADIVTRQLDYQGDTFTYGRKGSSIREEKSIAFSSIRSGGFPGSVKVIFGFEDERMELSAHVYNMNTYAKGMIEAGLFLNGKRPGLYRLEEVIKVTA